MKIVLGVLCLLLSSCGFEQVDTGRRGVKTHFGKVIGEPLIEGLYFYNPFSESVVELSVQEEKAESATECFTRDTQNVKVSFAITYYPDPKKIHLLYQNFGREWAAKIVSPLVLQSIKDVVGQYVADDLVGKRDEARSKSFEHLRGALAARDVIATSLSFTNLDFDDKYEKAVEDKVVAVQKAAEAKNKTVEIEENAKQRLIAAKADAEAMTIRAEALAKNRSLVEYEAVQKWDGKLPTYMLGGSNSTPFISLPSAK